MLAKAIVAATLLISGPAVPMTTNPVDIDTDAIVQVICPTPGGWTAGTAFRVGHGLILSVNHVTSVGTCKINGERIKVLYSSKQDFSMVAGGKGPFLRVDCGGFIRGRHYMSIGFARGLPFLTTVELIATGHKAGGFSLLSGIFTMIPGQSGGPVVDEETGKVVGTNNVFIEPDGLSGSLALADTPICKGANIA
jgi:hypothetical protein